MSTPPILLLGGHGKVARLMTPLLLANGHDVTSIVRDPAHVQDILALQPQTLEGAQPESKKPGRVQCLIQSLDDVKTAEQARAVIDEVRTQGFGVEYVVWSAGAGGKGGKERTYAIDRDACKAYVSASLSPGSGVKKFLLVSALLSRRDRAPWWTDDDWALIRETQTTILPDYYRAKLEADEFFTALYSMNKEGEGIVPTILRPGGLSDEPATGKVQLGRTAVKGMVTRGDVAEVAVRLLEVEGWKGGWVDVLGGHEEIEKAVERVVREGVDSVVGEDVEGMKKRAGLV